MSDSKTHCVLTEVWAHIHRATGHVELSLTDLPDLPFNREKWESVRCVPAHQSPDAADASRYRWLRDPQTDVALVLDKRTGYVPPDENIAGIGGYHTYEYRAGEELDAAIDAAIASNKEMP